MEKYQEKEFKENIAIAGKHGRRMDFLALTSAVNALVLLIFLPPWASGIIDGPMKWTFMIISIVGLCIYVSSVIMYFRSAYKTFPASDRWISALKYDCSET